MMDEMAPCPFCLKGYAIEFPPNGKLGRWGSEGFWQGQPIPPSLLKHWRENRPLPIEENRRRMQELHDLAANERSPFQPV